MQDTTTRTVLERELVEKARQLVPTLRALGPEVAGARVVPDRVIGLLRDAGLMSLLRPHRYGGPAVGADTAFRIARELARGDGSVAWVYAVLSAHDHLIGLYPATVQDAYWASPVPRSSSSYMPTGRATPAPGGFRLDGRWSFSSGVDNAGWVVVGAIVGMLPCAPPAPDLRFFLVPRSEIALDDDWHVLGLEGTGSKTLVFEQIFVPHERVLANEDIKAGTAPGATVHDDPLYRTSAWPLFGFCIVAPAVGLVQVAYDVVFEQIAARAKKSDPSFEARKASVFGKLAEVSAQVDAALLLYERGLTETSALIAAGLPLPIELKARNRRDQTYGTGLLRQAMSTLLGMSGGSGIYEHNHVQRAFRDLHALSAHPGGSWETASIDYGSVVLGGQPLEPLF